MNNLYADTLNNAHFRSAHAWRQRAEAAGHPRNLWHVVGQAALTWQQRRHARRPDLQSTETPEAWLREKSRKKANVGIYDAYQAIWKQAEAHPDLVSCSKQIAAVVTDLMREDIAASLRLPELTEKALKTGNNSAHDLVEAIIGEDWDIRAYQQKMQALHQIFDPQTAQSLRQTMADRLEHACLKKPGRAHSQFLQPRTLCPDHAQGAQYILADLLGEQKASTIWMALQNTLLASPGVLGAYVHTLNEVLPSLAKMHARDGQSALIVEQHFEEIFNLCMQTHPSLKVAESVRQAFASLNPDKAAALSNRPPRLNRLQGFAKAVVHASPATLRAMPTEDKMRAHSVLKRGMLLTKTSRRDVQRLCLAGYCALASYTPIDPSRKQELKALGRAFVDRFDQENLSELRTNWITLPFEERERHVLRWKAMAWDVFGLPETKTLECVDGLDFSANGVAAAGSNSFDEPMRVAIGRTRDPIEILQSLGHEALHEQHELVKQGHDTSFPHGTGEVWTYMTNLRNAGDLPANGPLYYLYPWEREAHFLDKNIRQELCLRHPTPKTQIFVNEHKNTTPLELPLDRVIACIRPDQNYDPSNQLAAQQASQEAAAWEDIRGYARLNADKTSIHILPLAGDALNPHELNPHHLRAMANMGLKTVTLHIPPHEAASVAHLVHNSPVAYELPPAPPLVVPSLDQVFGTPAQSPAQKWPVKASSKTSLVVSRSNVSL